MHTTRTISLTVIAACLLAGGGTAVAAEPATVTVRVEGSSETLLPPTQVTTTTSPVVKDGNPEHFCSGTNAVGALQLATGGNWSGTWFGASEFGPGEYSVETILGESHLFTGSTYWEFWIDNAPSEKGVCSKEVHNGDTLLFFPSCFGECPPPSNPLGIDAPDVATTAVPVPVTVTSYANAGGAASPASGASISYDGKTAETDAAGHAILQFADTGQQVVKVTKALSIRTQTSICVHGAGDGACGSGSAGRTSVAGFTSTTAPYKGPFALVAGLTSLLDGHLYRRGHAPRLISGRISSHSSVSSVSLALRRTYRGRCFAYDGARGRFTHARCGSASYFAVSKEAAFSYLLPTALAPGRYVLDVKAGDVAGNTTALARGTSRIVFNVR
ncbi:MAG: hypothetical protein QOK19_1592 [Solirubrobacteraceae bacterium]|nr:hypothetical protein [Solirubrobacteraceae bacterium]